MIDKLNVHWVRRIEVSYRQIESTKWIQLRLTNRDGQAFDLTAFVEGPLEIEGAELINLMAADPDPEPGDLCALLEQSIADIKAKKGEHSEQASQQL